MHYECEKTGTKVSAFQVKFSSQSMNLSSGSLQYSRIRSVGWQDEIMFSGLVLPFLAMATASFCLSFVAVKKRVLNLIYFHVMKS